MPTQTFFTWPDGGSEMVETFTESTALETAFNGTDHASVGRAAPRYQLTAGFVLIRDERSGLSVLDGASQFLVPAWMHPIDVDDSGVANVDAIHGVAASQQFVKKTASGYQAITSPVAVEAGKLRGKLRVTAWPTDALRGFPLLTMTLDEDAWDVTAQGRTVDTTSFSFVTDQLFEPIPTYTGPTTAGVPLLPNRHDWNAKPLTQTSYSQNKFDAGNLSSRHLRHTKKSVSVRFDFFGRAEILAFRLFIRQLRGRAGTFRWVAFDGIERTYRLGSDTWQLKWRGTRIASCSLRFVEA